MFVCVCVRGCVCGHISKLLCVCVCVYRALYTQAFPIVCFSPLTYCGGGLLRWIDNVFERLRVGGWGGWVK